MLGFIVPHKFINSLFGKGIRKFLSEKKLLQQLISFGHNFVFDDVTTYTCIILLKNSENEKFGYVKFGKMKTSSIGKELSSLKEKDLTFVDESIINDGPWVLSSGSSYNVLEKIRKSGPNILTYFDRILEGIITGDDTIFCLRPIKENTSTMVLFSEKTMRNVEIEKGILRPLLIGEDVKKYKTFQQAQYFVIYPYNVTDSKQRAIEEIELKNTYPLAYEYLFQFKEHLIELKRRFKTNPRYWYALHRGRRKEWFEQEKIITPEISFGCSMTLDKNNLFYNAKVYGFIRNPSTKVDNRFFLAILNSDLLWFFLKETGYVLRGGYFTFKTEYLKPFHIPMCNNENAYIQKVDKLLSLNKEFYSKCMRFENRMRSSFEKIEIPKNLQNFYNLNFNMFLDEINKATKNKMSLKDQDEWEEYFAFYKNDILKLKKRNFKK
jgi:TaqI-like C-terminal specificity domain/Eco57I restriction-modification methylase